MSTRPGLFVLTRSNGMEIDMTYQQAIGFIHDRLRLGSKLGLDTIGELLRRLGNPQNKLKFIHVAGTNGKGTTSAFIANILMASGYKTGMYVSPFVRSFTERIQVDGAEIPEEALARHTAAIVAVSDDNCCPTEFEVVTAIGFLHFLETGCDFVVLEVGLGGRFDATNIIPPPRVCVITSISIDHTELLGDTVEQIAFEKCGIIKKGCAVAVYPDNSEAAMTIIDAAVQANHATMKVGDKNAVRVIRADIGGTVFDYVGERYEIVMLGAHQVYNAVTAIEAAKLLGLDLRIAEGLKNTRFGGRLEIVSQKPMIVIDGAHNYSGVSALKSAILDYFPGKKPILVMGMLRDKEYEKCIAEIAPMASLFVATEPDNPRAIGAAELEGYARKYAPHTAAIADRQAAVDYAKAAAANDDVIFVCGSLYLIGGIRYI